MILADFDVNSMEDQAQEIIQFIRDQPEQNVSARALMDSFGVEKHRRRDFRKILRNLVRKGLLQRGARGTYRIPLEVPPIFGRLSCHPDGYGFVRPISESGPDIHVRADLIGNAIHGDWVEVEVVYEQKGPDRRRSGRIVGVRERSLAGIVGRYEGRGKTAFVVPDNPRLGAEIYISEEHRMNAKDGQIVVARITQRARKDFFAKGEIISVLGRREEAQIDSLMVAQEFGLSMEFSSEVLKEAQNVSKELTEEVRAQRRDLLDIPFVTIDGMDAKDFDDAVAVESRGRGEIRLYVAIADVAHYVREESLLDQEAYKRGNSVYFPDLVIPMLPEKLSNGICSLKPNEERLVICCAMDINRNGEVVQYGIDRAVIRSRQRMTYESVTEILEEGDSKLTEEYRDHISDFQQMRKLFECLAKRRKAQGALDFDLPESRILLDDKGIPTDILKRERTISHRMIEEFMLVANVTIAKHLTSFGATTLYRVHDVPNPEKIEFFATIARAYGKKLATNKLHTPLELAKTLDGVRGRPEAQLLSTLLLRSLAQAEYSTNNVGHFGLGFPFYTHFTSPIRRYADLIIHRQVHTLLEKGVPGLMNWSEKRQESLGEIGGQTSRRERVALDAERAIVSIKKVRFMAERVGDVFWGSVTGMGKAGIFVGLEECFVEGLIRMEDLGGQDRYEFDEERYVISGKRSGRSFRLGDIVEVEVSGFSLAKRTVDFSLIRKKGEN